MPNHVTARSGFLCESPGECPHCRKCESCGEVQPGQGPTEERNGRTVLLGTTCDRCAKWLADIAAATPPPPAPKTTVKPKRAKRAQPKRKPRATV